MLFTPIYIAMTFMRSWRIRSFRVRLLEFLSGNTSVAFCKVPEDAAETPSLSSKLCTNPQNAYLCELLDYTNTTRICSMKPNQCIELHDWVSCSGSMPLGSGNQGLIGDLDLDLLLECEMEQSQGNENNVTPLETMGTPVAWKAGSHLAIVLKTNIELLSVIGLNFVAGEFTIDHRLPVVRIQTIQLSGEPNKATDPSMRSLRSEVQNSLKHPPREFQWPIHAALLRKLSKVVDIKSDTRSTTIGMNGNSETNENTNIGRKAVSLADVSVNTTKSLTEDSIDLEDKDIIEPTKVTLELTTERNIAGDPPNDKNIVLSKDNVTVEIQHNINPKKSSLKLDLRKGTSQLSASLMNISSQIKSVTTHKRIVSTTGPKKPQPVMESNSKKEESKISSVSQHGTTKSVKSSRPLVNTKSPNVLIFSDSVVARDNLEASLRKVLDCDRYTIYSVNRSSLEGGWWRGRAALLAVAGEVGRAAPLLLAHLLDGGRLLALCSDLLHTVLPHYTTAEVRENEIVQFSYDKWQSVKMKHHIFCYQASPAKKQFSTESDRQPSKYSGHPGHEIDIQVLASEETWRTPSLLQATDLTNSGVAIFSQIHLETDPSDYLGDEGSKSNEARLEIIQKILGDILGMHVRDIKDVITEPQYTRGYFLGNHVHKLSLVEALGSDGKLGEVAVQWCFKGDSPKHTPSADFIPVYVHECPENFSTVEYYDNLTSSEIGRVVVYADVLSCTQTLCTSRLWHGAAIVARTQTAGRGRGGNAWLSPSGCAMMSLQLIVQLTARVSLLQQCAALAAVRAVRSLPHYEHLDIRIKWPNDIYFGRDVKIGGVVTTANCEGDEALINIGTGVNISNSVPTTCVNDIIAAHNKSHRTSLPPLSVEKFLARYCSQLERILLYVDTDGGIDAFLEQYYAYWLHDGEEVRVLKEGESEPIRGIVSGVDEGGWLRVRTLGGELKVTPDGNTFDMMAGLIAPKQ